MGIPEQKFCILKICAMANVMRMDNRNIQDITDVLRTIIVTIKGFNIVIG